MSKRTILTLLIIQFSYFGYAQPLQYKKSHYFSITFQTSQDTIEKLVPFPLIANKKGTIILEITNQNRETEILPSYNEVILSIPVEYKGQKSLFYKLLYLDKTPPITGGRERWGFPKYYADIDLRISKQKTSATVRVNGNVVIQMSGILGNEIASPNIINHQEWYVHKRIPSIEQGKMDVDELNAVYVDNFKTYNSRILNAEIELKSFPHEKMGKIPVIKILKAVYFQCDFVLGFGRTEFNFLDASKNSSNR